MLSLISHTSTWLSSLLLRYTVLSATWLWPPPFIHAWSLSSMLCDSQWGGASNRDDPWRAPLWLVPLSPSSSSVLTRLIPHSLPVKGPKPWLLVAHANISGWKMGQRERGRERERERERKRGRQTEAGTVIAMAANHRQTLRVEWINALSTWDRVHSLSQPGTHA